MQSIVDKTALFLSKQNSQMEIVLKTKQSGNPQFGFLNYDHYLNKYYKLILRKIKEDGYVPILESSKEDAKKTEAITEGE
jgi:Surp module.